MTTRGAAKTDKFLIGSCDLLIGKVGELASLTTENSIGLVKDITVEFTPSYVDLQQGIQNNTVFSARVGSESRLTGSSYEYTDKNLSYAAGLKGDEVMPVVGTPYTTTAVPTAGAADNTTLFEIDTPAPPQTIQQGDMVLIHSPNFSKITKVADVGNLASNEITLSGNFLGVVVAGAKISKINVLALGKAEPVNYFCAKAIGELPNGDVIVVEIPKCQFTSGLSVAFTTNDFSNMALELKPIALLASDESYAEFGDSIMRVAQANIK